jgi:phosphoribosylformimino-5-aminoimidazole carboxamide ribotide isomerase
MERAGKGGFIGIGCMKIVPVLDLLGGEVVHAVGGQRQHYRRVKSVLTTSAAPLDVAIALHDRFGFQEFYVADLGAISGGAPDFAIYAALQAAGFHLWVDAGIVDAPAAFALAQSGVARIIAGLETLAGPDALAAICRVLGALTIFSLDLRSGQPQSRVDSWKKEAWEVLEQAVDAGASSVLLLDLAKVGMQGGPGTEDLCERLTASHPVLQVIAGGGIRNANDLLRLRKRGVSAALMATALHDGSVTPGDLEAVAH